MTSQIDSIVPFSLPSLSIGQRGQRCERDKMLTKRESMITRRREILSQVDEGKNTLRSTV